MRLAGPPARRAFEVCPLPVSAAPHARDEAGKKRLHSGHVRAALKSPHEHDGLRDAGHDPQHVLHLVRRRRIGGWSHSG